MGVTGIGIGIGIGPFDLGVTSASATKVVLPGTSGNYLSTPDSAALSITGDIDIIAHIAPNDWTTAGNQAPVSKFGGYMVSINTAGRLVMHWTPAGNLSQTSTAAVPASDGEAIWVRATLDVNNGASGYDVTFYTSTDGMSWTQLGAVVTGGATTSIADTAVGLEIGSYNNGTSYLFAGEIYRVIVKSGIDGTVVFDMDPSVAAPGATQFAESSSNAATVTVNGTAEIA